MWTVYHFHCWVVYMQDIMGQHNPYVVMSRYKISHIKLDICKRRMHTWNYPTVYMQQYKDTQRLGHLQTSIFHISLIKQWYDSENMHKMIVIVNCELVCHASIIHFLCIYIYIYLAILYLNAFINKQALCYIQFCLLYIIRNTVNKLACYICFSNNLISYYSNVCYNQLHKPKLLDLIWFLVF